MKITHQIDQLSEADFKKLQKKINTTEKIAEIIKELKSGDMIFNYHDTNIQLNTNADLTEMIYSAHFRKNRNG